MMVMLVSFVGFADMQAAFDEAVSSGCIGSDVGWYSNATDDAILAYKLIIQTGDVDDPIDRNRVGGRLAGWVGARQGGREGGEEGGEGGEGREGTEGTEGREGRDRMLLPALLKFNYLFLL